jgi:hypothetical protein
MESTLRPCRRCGGEAVLIAMQFDGNTVDMESCDRCDTRVWSVAGEPVELDHVLNEVGLRSSRRRSS